MNKYQWNDTNLKKKSQVYDWLMIIFAAVALIVWKWLSFLPEFMLLGLLGGAVVCFTLSWRAKSQDTRLRTKNG